MISSRGFPPVCFNSYANWPISAARDITNMTPSPHPIPGLSHLTISGRTHTGNQGIEMWYETLAPGRGTPIHKHDCEEIFLVLSGNGGTMRQLASDGSVITQSLKPNSTITVLPNARHQFLNEGEDDVSFIVAFDNVPMRAVVYQSWEALDVQGKSIVPLPWDTSCPPDNPDAGPLLKKSGEKGAKDEL